MKHCVLLTAYKNVEQINEFIKLLPKDWGIYIHIDKKSLIEKSQITRGNVYKEFKIYWGGVEHLLAYLFLLKKASIEEFDYYHLITGQCFPCSPFSEFDIILGNNKHNYIEITPLPREGWWHGGYDLLRYKTFTSYMDIRFGFKEKVHMFFWHLQKKLHLGHKLPNYKCYSGVVYCSLTNEAINYIINSNMTMDLLSRLSNSICAEELFFQTILRNSHLSHTIVNNNLRYIDWKSRRDGEFPAILNEDDFEQIVKSRSLFCRKIDINKSEKLIEKLINYIMK